MSPRPHDTTPAGWLAYEAAIAEMDGSARLYVAIELSEDVRKIRTAGLRARHPELSEQELVHRLVLEEYGITLSGAR